MSGYSAAGFRSWQRTARRLESGAGAAGICLNDQGGDRMEVSEDVAATLRAETHGHLPCIVDEAIPLEHHPIDSRITMTDNGKVQTLTSRMGTGGNNVPLVMKIRSGCEGGGKGALVQTDKSATLSCNNDQTVFVPFGISSYQSHAMLSDNPHSGIYEAETARTLDRGGGNPSCNQGGIAVVAFTQNQRDEVRDLGDHSAVVCASAGTKQPTFVLQGSMIGRSEKNGPQGSGVNEDVCFTLDTADRLSGYPDNRSNPED